MVEFIFYLETTARNLEELKQLMNDLVKLTERND